MSGRTADGTTRTATDAAGTGTLAATPKQRGAAGRAEAVRTVTMTIARDVRIAATAAGSGIPAAIPRPRAADGKTVADNEGCVRPPGRTHRPLPPSARIMAWGIIRLDTSLPHDCWAQALVDRARRSRAARHRVRSWVQVARPSRVKPSDAFDRRSLPRWNAVLATRNRPGRTTFHRYHPPFGWRLALDTFVRKLRHGAWLDENDERSLRGLADGVRRVHTRGDILHEGGTPRFLTLVLEGWACTYRALENGQRQILSILLPGDLAEPFGILPDRRSFHRGRHPGDPRPDCSRPHPDHGESQRPDRAGSMVGSAGRDRDRTGTRRQPRPANGFGTSGSSLLRTAPSSDPGRAGGGNDLRPAPDTVGAGGPAWPVGCARQPFPSGPARQGAGQSTEPEAHHS